MTGFALNVLVWSAIALGVASIILTALIVVRLERDNWPHGYGRLCPDPQCACGRSAARRSARRMDRLIAKGPRRAR